MRALIDTNVILDVLLERQPFLPASADVWIANEQAMFEGYVSAITPVNVYYVARSYKRDKLAARQLVQTVLDAFQICTVSADDLRVALSSRVDDYEDAVQVVNALRSQVDIIVTRDTNDFARSPVRALTPVEFVDELD